MHIVFCDDLVIIDYFSFNSHFFAIKIKKKNRQQIKKRKGRIIVTSSLNWKSRIIPYNRQGGCILQAQVYTGLHVQVQRSKCYRGLHDLFALHLFAARCCFVMSFFVFYCLVRLVTIWAKQSIPTPNTNNNIKCSITAAYVWRTTWRTCQTRNL